MCLASWPNPRVGVWAYRKGSEVTLDLDSACSDSPVALVHSPGLALTPLRPHAPTPILRTNCFIQAVSHPGRDFERAESGGMVIKMSCDEQFIGFGLSENGP
jgi:hypothetical protein